MHDEDKEETIDVIEQIEIAAAGHDINALRDALAQIKEILFFVEE